MEPNTQTFLAVVAQAARERTRDFAVVISPEDRLAIGTTAMMPVRPSLNPILVTGPRR